MWVFNPLFVDGWLQVIFFLEFISVRTAVYNYFSISSSFIRLNRVYINKLTTEKKFGKRCLMMIPIRTFNSLFSGTRDTSNSMLYRMNWCIMNCHFPFLFRSSLFTGAQGSWWYAQKIRCFPSVFCHYPQNVRDAALSFVGTFFWKIPIKFPVHRVPLKVFATTFKKRPRKQSNRVRTF